MKTTQRPIHATSREPDQSAGANDGARTAPAKAPMTAGGLKAARGELARLRRSSRLEIEHRLARSARRSRGRLEQRRHHAQCGRRPDDRMSSMDPLHGLSDRADQARATVSTPQRTAESRRRAHRIDGLDRRRRYWSRNPVPAGQRHHSPGPGVISAAPPMGHALIGAATRSDAHDQAPMGRPQAGPTRRRDGHREHTRKAGWRAEVKLAAAASASRGHAVCRTATRRRLSASDLMGVVWRQNWCSDP